MNSISMEDLSGLMTPPSSPPKSKDDNRASPDEETECEKVYVCHRQHHDRVSLYHSARSQSDTRLIQRRRLHEAETESDLKEKDDDEFQDGNDLYGQILEKYDCEDEIMEDVFVRGMGSPGKHMPGKRSSSGCLELVVLNHKGITHCGAVDKLTPWLNNITELDLAGNRLSSWKQVLTLLYNSPVLSHCNFSQNPLYAEIGESLIDQCASANSCDRNLPRLKSIVLNGTSIQWSTLYQLLDISPSLEELHLSLNDYSSESVCPSVASRGRRFATVHTLHLNKCRITNWDRLTTIVRHFPSLENLVVADNPIDRISSPVWEQDDYNWKTELKSTFECLLSFNCNKWHLRHWECIEKLRHLPLLCDLRINNLPILEQLQDEERRHLVIARLPDVTTLNGSRVTEEQRITAERAFIRHYMEQREKPHRFDELEAIHGKLDALVQVDLSPKHNSQVRLYCKELQLDRLHLLALNQSVGQFKKSLQSICGVAPSRLRVFYVDKEMVGGSGEVQELRYLSIRLHSLRVQDGDEFHIELKPLPRTRRRTTSNKDEEQPVTNSSGAKRQISTPSSSSSTSENT